MPKPGLLLMAERICKAELDPTRCFQSPGMLPAG